VGDLGPIAVSPAHAGRGIGTALVRAALAWATQRGAGAIFALAWSDAQGPHAAKILERSDFTALPPWMTLGMPTRLIKVISVLRAAGPAAARRCSMSALS
jgi:GNAT superfamily N-acetyltransferase